MKKTTKKVLSFALALTLTFTAFTAVSEDKETSPVSISVSAASAKLSAPTGFEIKGYNGAYNGNITISWKEVKNADAYAVYKYNEKTKKYEKYKTVKSNKITLKNLQSGVTYKFKFAALDKKNNKYVTGKMSGVVNVTADSADYKELYKEVLFDFMESENYYSDSMFDLYDMDNDGIPELFISSGEYHAAEVYIYTIYNNEAVEMNALGSWGVAMVCDDYILSQYTGQGMQLSNVYKKSGKSLKKIISYTDYTMALEYFSENAGQYEVNGDFVSESEFDKATSKYSSMDWVEVGRRYSLSNKGINEAFGS